MELRQSWAMSTNISFDEQLSSASANSHPQNFFAIHSRAAANSKVDWPSSLPNLKINLAIVARQGAQERVD
jgi:hypothetical protein